MLERLKMREAQRESSVVFGACSMLALLPERDLDLLDLPVEMRTAIAKIRRQDDYAGVGVAYFVTCASNAASTSVDKTVMGQIMGVASSCILQGKVPTKAVFDKNDVLTDSSTFSTLMDWIKADGPASGMLQGDAWLENVDALVTYVEQYNRDLSSSSSLLKFGSEGNNESGLINDMKKGVQSILDQIDVKK